MRVAVLWARLSGYMNACLKALAQTERVELFVASIRVSEDAPFDESPFSWIENHYQWESDPDEDELISRLERFQPDVILAAGWHNSGYRKAFKCYEGRAIRVFSMDNQWLGRPKQWLGVFASRLYLHPICDAVFVAGERQAVFAHKLGFPQRRILRGVYSCDHEEFARIHFERKKTLSEPRAFVFVGRFAPEKGAHVLVDAYRCYRETAPDPWPLKCYGTGPLQHLIQGVEGIECKGFCQPEDLPRELSMASCLLLPSTFEPWALVVHEAAAAGMAVIVSDAVGASVHLVQDGYNGYTVETGNAHELTQAMLRYSSMSRKERSTMGENSYSMSLQYTPSRWADTLVTKARELAPNQ
ncbi:MAG: glycosyltransferase family 4 protein [Thermoleophilia bacterium]